MPPITKRRTGKGYEREIQALTRLRTAIVLDDKLDMASHAHVLGLIDELISTLSKFVREGRNIDSTPPPGILKTQK